MITTLLVLLVAALIIYVGYRVVKSNTVKDTDGDRVPDDLDIFDNGRRYETPAECQRTGMETAGYAGTSGNSPGEDMEIERQRRADEYNEGLFIPVTTLDDEDEPILEIPQETETSNADINEQTDSTPAFDGFEGDPQEMGGAGAGGSWEEGETTSAIPVEFQATQDDIPSPVTENYVQSESIGESDSFTPSETSSNDTGQATSSVSDSSDTSSSTSSSSSNDSGSSYDSGSYSGGDSGSSSSDSSGGDTGGGGFGD